MNAQPSNLTNAEVAAEISAGGQEMVADLFQQYKAPLSRMINFRLDRRLYGRVDAADVLQEAFLTIIQRYPEYIENPCVTFFVWMRQLTFQTLMLVHRRNFSVKKRDVNREVSINRGDSSDATSLSIAAQLADDITSPSHAAMRGERSEQLKLALAEMDEVDREVLALRHFEQLSNKEVSEVLGLTKTAASNRYIRAMERLKIILDQFIVDNE